jgi:hypothetical protein
VLNSVQEAVPLHRQIKIGLHILIFPDGLTQALVHLSHIERRPLGHVA